MSMSAICFDELGGFFLSPEYIYDVEQTVNHSNVQLNFRQIFESCPEKYLVLLPDSPRFTIVAVSESYLQVTMTQRKDLIGRGVFEAFPDNPNDPEATGTTKLRESLERVLKTKQPDAMALQQYDIRRPQSEGGQFEVRYWSPLNSPVLDSKGHMTAIIHRVEDVTEFLKARSAQVENEEAIRESRDRLFSILDTAYDCFISMDSQGRIADWNRQAEKTFGWAKNEVIGRPLHETVIPPRYRDAHIHGLKRFLETGIGPVLGKRLELTACRKDGSEIPIELTISVVKLAESYVFCAFLKDITEAKNNDQFKNIQLEVTRILVSSTSVQEAFSRSLEIICKGFQWEWGALWIFDSTGQRLILSHHFSLKPLELIDFETTSQRMAFPNGIGLPGRVWQNYQPCWAINLASDPNFPRREAAARCGLHSGAALPVFVGHRFYGALEFLSRELQGSNQKLLEIMADLATRLGFFILREESEDQLRESEQRFSALVENLKDYAIIGLNPEGKVTSWNSGAREILGFSPEEILGQHLSIFYPDEAASKASFKLSLETARKYGRFEEERWHLRKDGSRFWANVIIAPLYDPLGELKGFTKVLRDMTERKKIEERLSRLNEELERRVAERTEELRQAKMAAEEANQAKSVFLANMSHEIRTPLGVVLGFTELMMNTETTDEEKRTYIETIKRNGELLSNIINDILDLSKVETGKVEVEKKDTAIQDIISDISSHLALKAQEKGLLYEVSTEGVIPDFIQTDPIRLRQILTNIIGNAIKFTDQGFIRVKLKMITAPSAPPRLAFVVQDSGRGISPEQAQKLFRPFSQADASTTRKFGGTGLGLVLSQRMARLLGGDVVLSESQLGKGSTFTIFIDPGPIWQLGHVEMDNSESSL